MKHSLATLFAAASLLVALAQDSASDSGTAHHFGIEDDPYLPRNPREYQNGRFADFPNWNISKQLPNDTFTFARLRYPSGYDHYGYSRRRGGGGKWMVDYPDSDIDLSFRLQQMTSIQVNPNGVIVDIDPAQMRNYPFIYMLEVGQISLSDEQAHVMRDYMLNGGFIMVDDFWGSDEWDAFEQALKQIWPDRKYVELELEHDIFHCVFDLKVKPQIPGIGFAQMAHARGMTQFYEWNKPNAETVHYRAYYDDRQRMCMIICWNTDTGDGWEEEGTDPWYFSQFSEKYAYPLGINIIFYALTH